MKTELYLQIPTACHENWNEMTPVEKGRFCSSCNKQVVDFSLMTDAEVLNHFKKSTGNTCGRFYPDQLGRALQETKIEKKRGWKWLVASMVSLVMLERVNGQKKTRLPEALKPKSVQTTSVRCAVPKIVVDEDGGLRKQDVISTAKQTTGKPSVPDAIPVLQRNTPALEQEITGIVGYVVCVLPKQSVVNGRVTDEQSNPLAGVTVYSDKIKQSAVTDAQGYFKMSSSKNPSSIDITFAAVGFETKKMNTQLKNRQAMLNVSMKPMDMTLGEIVIGKVAPCRKPNFVDTVNTTIHKIVNAAANVFANEFKMYPNPVSKGVPLQIAVTTLGVYDVVLTDEASRILYNQEATAISKQQTLSISIPANIAPGYYYVQIVNRSTKRSATQKLIVQ